MCVQVVLHLWVGGQQVEAEDASMGGVVNTCLQQTQILLSTFRWSRIGVGDVHPYMHVISYNLYACNKTQMLNCLNLAQKSSTTVAQNRHKN